MNIADIDGTQVVGRVINLSADGFMLLSREPVRPQQISRLRMVLPEARDANGSIRFTARCIWCQKSSYSEDYGAGFRIEDITPDNRKILNALFDQL